MILCWTVSIAILDCQSYVRTALVLNIWLLAGGAALEGGKTFWGGVLEIDVWGVGLEAYSLALLPVPRR